MPRSLSRRNQESEPARGRAFKRSLAGGYTIVETLIVMVMASLILLLVLRAIPTLQRSSRNNQRQQDVQIVLEAISRYELNNSGGFPVNCGQSGATACTNVDGAQPNDFFLRFDLRKLTFYVEDPAGLPPTSSTLISLAAQPRPTGIVAGVHVTQLDHVTVQNYRKCETSPDGPPDGSATSRGAGYNDVVALYAIETGNAPASQCRQL
jgi:type II secretory pathway pseudopilin PulG